MLTSLSYFLETPHRRGKRQSLSLSATINKRIRDGVIEKKTETRQKTAAEKRGKSTTTFYLH